MINKMITSPLFEFYAPELNSVELVWDELREKYFHNRIFDSLDALEDQLEVALHTFENNAPMVKSVVAAKWIVSALLNKKWNNSQLLPVMVLVNFRLHCNHFFDRLQSLIT